MSDVRILPLPNGFDPANESHMSQLNRLVSLRAAGWKIFRLDSDHHRVVLIPEGSSGVSDEVKVFKFDRVAASDVKGLVARLEESQAGLTVVSVDVVNGLARMAVLDERRLLVRRLVAQVVGLPVWQVSVFYSQEDEGFTVKLPDGFAWVDSKFHARLLEVCAQVGGVGWFYVMDVVGNVLRLVPGVPPNFPPVVPVPSDVSEHAQEGVWQIGVALPEAGETEGERVAWRFEDSPGLGVGGTTGGGKSVVLNTIIFQHVAAGGRVVLVDDKAKSADFEWLKPWIGDHGWGGDGAESILACLRYVLEEVQVRAARFREWGIQKWSQLTAEQKRKMPLIMLMADEVSQYAVPPAKVAGEKDSPVVVQNRYDIAIAAAINQTLLKITQVARFAGVCFVLSAQSFTLQSGIDPKVKANLGGRLLMGVSASENMREQILADARRAARIPVQVVEGDGSKGVGVAELGGSRVVKAFYSADEQGSQTGFYASMLDRLGVKRLGDGSQAVWSDSDLREYVPEVVDKPVGVLTPRLRRLQEVEHFGQAGDGSQAGSGGSDGGDGSDGGVGSVPVSGGVRASVDGVQSGAQMMEYMGLLAERKGL